MFYESSEICCIKRTVSLAEASPAALIGFGRVRWGTSRVMLELMGVKIESRPMRLTAAGLGLKYPGLAEGHPVDGRLEMDL